MAGSHGSYEDRIGKFRAGDALIQSWGDYDPTNPLITAAGSTAFIASVEGVNSSVVVRKNAVGKKQDARKELCFTLYDDNTGIGITNPDCAEQRIVRVYSYMKGVLPENGTTLKAVDAVLNKIRPRYKGATSNKTYNVDAGKTITINIVVDGEPAKNTGSTMLSWQEVGSTEPPVQFGPKEETIIKAPSGKVNIKNLSNTKRGRVRLVIESGKELTKSPSEKTFASLPGFLGEVNTLAEGIDPSVYNPPDPMLTVSELTDLRSDIVTANNEVTTAMDIYGKTNSTRKDLYDGQEGMSDRIRLTKSYLASFSGGKKSTHYIEYSQALKGT